MIRLALIGAGIGGSLTPALHEAEASAQGLALRYGRIDSDAAAHHGLGFDALLSQAEADGLDGLNVTHPFKLDAARAAVRLDGAAAILGAANTLLRTPEGWVGANTDHGGFRDATRAGLPSVAGREVLVLGAGGAGGAVALALLELGAAVRLADLAAGRAEALARRLTEARPGTAVTVGRNADGVAGAVNASPVGMSGHPGLPIDPAALPAGAWVADIVYIPRETAFLRAARAAGRPVMAGGAMAVGQAARAFGLFTGRKADAGRMARHFAAMVAAETAI